MKVPSVCRVRSEYPATTWQEAFTTYEARRDRARGEDQHFNRQHGGAAAHAMNAIMQVPGIVGRERR